MAGQIQGRQDFLTVGQIEEGACQHPKPAGPNHTREESLPTTMTSAVPIIEGTGTRDAAHRTETPVWAFHHAIEVTGWAVDVAAYRIQEWEHRAIARRPLTTAYIALGLVATAIVSSVAVIGGAL